LSGVLKILLVRNDRHYFVRHEGSRANSDQGDEISGEDDVYLQFHDRFHVTAGFLACVG